MRRAPTLLALATLPSLLLAQARQPGHPIGKVTTIGSLIHLELDSGAIAPERLFDLDHRTLRFTPDGAGYRVENLPLVWDADFGPALNAATATLTQFKFPFSGRTWDTLNVATGALTFGAMQGGRGGGRSAGGSTRGGFQMERYAALQTVGRTFINMIPGIAAFTRVGSNGQRYMKELADRAVVTWTLSEGAGGIQAFSWTPTVNRIQAVLHKNGVIELSYNDVNAKDAVVGVFPIVTTGNVKAIASIADAEDPGVAANLDLKSVKLSAIDGLFLNATIETRGPILPESPAAAQQSAGNQPVDPGISGLTYRFLFKPTDASKPSVVWTIRGFAGRGFGGGGGRGAFQSRYFASGAGVEPDVAVPEIQSL
jgi:hypothetical protein